MVEPAEPAAPAVTNEPCEPLELPDDPRDRERTIEVRVQTAATERDAACLVRAIEESYPGLAAQSPPPPSLNELRKWWEIVGYPSHYFKFGADALVILPELPKPLDSEQRRLLEPLLCAPRAPESCSTESRSFLIEAERQLWSLTQLQRFEQAEDAEEEEPESTVERCAEIAKDRYDIWKSCIRRLVPTRLIAPSDAFRLPERGVLKTSVGGFWSTCFESRAHSLKSGLVLTRVACWPPSSNRGVIRYRVERAHPSTARHVALFIALSKELQRSPAYAKSFTAPAGLKKNPRWHVPRVVMSRSVADAVERHYELHGVLGMALKGRLVPRFEDKLEQRYLVELLDDLDEASAPSCATSADKAELSELFAHVANQDENLDQVLASVACTP